jgi:isopentenyl phosphate kinase
MFTFIKFGGSVITDKSGREAADLPLIRRLAQELAAARAADPGVPLIISHGSGSFGHHYAAQYGVHRGIAAGGDYHGFALTAAAALRLNRIVVDELLAAGIPAFSLQPSASLSSAGGTIETWQTAPLSAALARGLVPVIHGDVSLDRLQGSAIISTEKLLAFLALHSELQPRRIILVGEQAVFDRDPHRFPNAQRIPLIDSTVIDRVIHVAAGSHAVDVTGGMQSKLQLMWQLITAVPGLEVQLIGPDAGLLRAALADLPPARGTLMRR